jgi:hypothetical protein
VSVKDAFWYMTPCSLLYFSETSYHLPDYTASHVVLGITRNQHTVRTARFWAITQRVAVIPYRRFGTIVPIFRVMLVPKSRYGIATSRCVTAQKCAAVISFAAEA